MMLNLLRRSQLAPTELLDSKLFDQDTFYPAFGTDLKRCRKQVVIESPFVTTSRIVTLLPIFQTLRKRGVTIVINTRDPQDYDAPWSYQAYEALGKLQNLGVQILYKTKKTRTRKRPKERQL